MVHAINGITFWDQVVVSLMASHLHIFTSSISTKSCMKKSIFFWFWGKEYCIMLSSLGVKYFL